MANNIDKDIELIIPGSFRGKYNGKHIRWDDHKGDYIFIKFDNNIYNILISDVDVES